MFCKRRKSKYSTLLPSPPVVACLDWNGTERNLLVSSSTPPPVVGLGFGVRSPAQRASFFSCRLDPVGVPGTPNMAANVGESTSGSGSGSDAGGSFECNICFELPQEPIVTLCGHLFCWPCLYKWLHIHSHSPECPVCKAVVEEDKLVPLYGRGKDRVDPRSKNVPGAEIPNRPAGQRPATAPQADPNNHFPNANPNPWFMGGGGIPLANARWGNYTFSAAFGGLFPLLSFQVHGFPDATAYGQPAGFPYGYGHGHGHGHAFHGGHAGHAHAAPRHGPPGQQQQADVYLKALLILVGFLVIASLISF
ncbi:uncharacterized protein LOC133904868 isoform X2 [Phragmites australis]|uniref:uncharacterized protein LOC133904868 isoform X2 n=1 Tax=Phragmites australis TaxID=29695 RepID=UPI002D773CCD|nr:uncharacterized protein LOC133904868 isoform X2 [Phragmites australis]